jgi:ribulose 1,5-bisphosphate carboxylase large subunit-like protein
MTESSAGHRDGAPAWPPWSPPRGTFLGIYDIETRTGLQRTAEFIALEESAGGWSGGGAATERYQRSLASVLAVHEIAPDRGYAAIAFPTANLPERGSVFPAIWLYLTAGPLFERPFADVIRLADVLLPEEVLATFGGPRFGIRGTRDFVRAEEGAFLFGAIVKPGGGLTPDEVAARCEAAARGGVHLIKDDEKMNNPSYCPLRERVRAVSRALRRAEDATGHRVIYCPHITGRPDQMVEEARVAVAAGATGLMVNVFAAGLAALEMLRDDARTAVPIYVHSGGRSALSHRPGNGIEARVFARFVRLLGGDYLDLYAQGGYLRVEEPAEALRLAGILRDPWGPIAPVLPACSGGLSALTLGQNYALFGTDLLPMAGSAIFSHPLGPAAGVAALRQAAESYSRGIPLEEYGRTHPELAAAVHGT